MILYALFLDGKQISKAHTTRAAAMVEAFERGAVERRSEDFPGDPPAHTALAPRYEIRHVVGSPQIKTFGVNAEPARTYIATMTDTPPDRHRDDEATGWGRYNPEHEPSGEEELYFLILRLVQQDCETKEEGTFDSWAISAYEAAICALADAGFVELDREGRIGATLTEQGRRFEAWMEFHERRKRIAEARHYLATVPGARERRQAVARLYGLTVDDLGDEQT